jgi:hypothetical protein
MEYRIIEHQDDIEIFNLEGNKLLDVTRKYTWTGVRKSKFYDQGRLILDSEFRSFLFNRSLLITYQDLRDEIVVVKKGRILCLSINNNILHLTINPQKYPFCTFMTGENRSALSIR